MVRLGLYCQALGRAILYTFNPTVVRLGPGALGAPVLPLSDLSIPLWCDWDTPILLGLSLPHLPFNPTVVRLGQVKGMARRYVITVFQSHCGAIGTRAGRPPLCPACPTFNPTVVRLGQVRELGGR